MRCRSIEVRLHALGVRRQRDLHADAPIHLRDGGANALAGLDHLSKIFFDHAGPFGLHARHVLVEHALVAREAAGIEQHAELGVDACTICGDDARSEEHTSELQSLMSIWYDVFCLKKKTYSNR